MPPSNERKRTKRNLTARLWLVLLVVLIIANLVTQSLHGNKPQNGEGWVVKRVISGQTIEASVANDDTGIVQRVRLIGVSAPLREQSPWGDRARLRLEELVKDQTVILEFDSDRKDNSERLLAYVWIGNRLINAQLLKEGYVLTDLMLPNVKYESDLKQAQSEARLLGVGVWDAQNPMRQAPKDFRRS